jgi:hypothetical protein
MSHIQSGGENVDWYRLFEGIKSIQKENSLKNVPQQSFDSSPPSPFSIVPIDALHPSSSDDQISASHLISDSRLIQSPQGVDASAPIQLNPVKVFLSTTIEPNLKKRKLLPADDISEATADTSTSVTSNKVNGDEEDDPLEKYVTTYMNSKPFGM